MRPPQWLQGTSFPTDVNRSELSVEPRLQGDRRRRRRSRATTASVRGSRGGQAEPLVLGCQSMISGASLPRVSVTAASNSPIIGEVSQTRRLADEPLQVGTTRLFLGPRLG